MNKAKLIFSKPLFLFRYLGKTKLDNFVGGLIVGSIFSLLVNIFTVSIQESIHKQRVLEALENEILNNGLVAGDVIRLNSELLDGDLKYSPFRRSNTYSTKVWDSSESLQYLLELDPLVQGRVSAFYSAIIGGSNDMLNNSKLLNNERLLNCYINETTLSLSEKLLCSETYKSQLKMEVMSASLVYEQTGLMLKEFHPTRDRLKNPFLRLFMGDKAVGALKVEPY